MKLVENIKNETTTELKGDKILMHGRVTDSYDAEEYLRHIDEVRRLMEATASQLEEYKKLYNLMKDRKDEAQKIRDKELVEAKKERKKYEVK